MTAQELEFYETPAPFVRYLFSEVPIHGRVFECCAGDGAIVDAQRAGRSAQDADDCSWITNDIDPRWTSGMNGDATKIETWDAVGPVDWTVSNPPFTPAIEIITLALEHSRVGVAMHLRASIHEMLKTGVRRTWMARHTPTGILWLPRFAYQRSKTTGKWTTDSVCACWVIWLRDQAAPQFIRYAPEWVVNQLDDETPAYRKRMDVVMARTRTVGGDA